MNNKPRQALQMLEFLEKLARELRTVGIQFGTERRLWRVRTCAVESCQRQFWTATESSHRYPTCSPEHREMLSRNLNAARQRRYTQRVRMAKRRCR